MKRLLLFAALIAWSGMAGAVVYKWVDAQGKVQYGDRPPDGVHAEVVELLGTHAARVAPASETAPAAKRASPPNQDDAADKKAVEQRRGADPRQAMHRGAGPLQEIDRGPASSTKPAPTANAST